VPDSTLTLRDAGTSVADVVVRSDRQSKGLFARANAMTLRPRHHQLRPSHFR
jgi:hypothetical protein